MIDPVGTRKCNGGHDERTPLFWSITNSLFSFEFF